MWNITTKARVVGARNQNDIHIPRRKRKFYMIKVTVFYVNIQLDLILMLVGPLELLLLLFFFFGFVLCSVPAYGFLVNPSSKSFSGSKCFYFCKHVCSWFTMFIDAMNKCKRELFLLVATERRTDSQELRDGRTHEDKLNLCTKSFALEMLPKFLYLRYNT